MPSEWLISSYVPQVSILRRASVLVTHAGNNSVTEALAHGVPMLTLPFSSDQFDGAAAIEAAHLGLAADPNRVTPLELAEAVRCVIGTSHPALDRLAVELALSPGPGIARAAVGKWLGRVAAVGTPRDGDGPDRRHGHRPRRWQCQRSGRSTADRVAVPAGPRVRRGLGPTAVTTSVVWFRRDLRLHDHPALTAAQSDGARIAPLFVLDERLQAGRFRSANRLWFMRGSVSALATALEIRGAPLSVVRGDPSEVVPAFAAAVRAGRVVASRDYTPYGRARDRVAAALGRRGIAWASFPGLLVHEPEDVATAEGRPFRVFGPFRRTWLDQIDRAVLAAPDAIAGARRVGGRRIEDLLETVTPSADLALLPVPGEDAARERLARWTDSQALERYATDRDRLDLDGTSRLGQDLRWGLLSPTEVAARSSGAGEGRQRFLGELAWRDFYAHLLWHEPRAARASWRPSLERVAWEHDPRIIDARRTGRTGFPVVDAAMRQLTTSG